MLRLPKLTFKAKVLKVLNNSAIKKRDQTNSTTTGGPNIRYPLFLCLQIDDSSRSKHYSSPNHTNGRGTPRLPSPISLLLSPP